MQRKLALISISALALTWVTTAIARDDDGPQRARNAQLKGAYAYMGTFECLVSGAPFNPNFTPSGFTVSFRADQVGIQTFHGDGTSTWNSRAVSINPPPMTNTQTNPPSNPLGVIGATQVDATGQINYNIDNDGLITMDVAPGTVIQGRVLAGAPAGSTYTFDHHRLSGMMSSDKKTIVLGTVDLLMETQTITPVVGSPSVHYRVCSRTTVLTKIDDK